MMNSRRICPADGSQYKVSAVGLVFMESAAGLAMETSKVESAVRNQAKAKLNQLEHIAIQEAKKSRKMELERRRSAGSYCQSAVGYQQMKRSERDEATSC
ncbi:structural maintenance of chromosomes protein 2-1 [Dorcoceras hygrometricum]|uniref:Structural maintenance of chromosomes protein 2-1 n=1 Tax=Dorcoceras hygrometricum TaxID=472368 RepID=A0A2Z7A0X4_9LAMI|nr:structural maintenance of chromosomes protein 2-1 [Dorcoceras hygrometricum]